MSDDGGGARVYLTGATGFIGGRLAAALHARGYRLRCLVRTPENAGALMALGAELVVGDVADERAHAQGLEGAHLAWHVAGAYSLGVVDVAAMERTNVAGTAAFLAALRGASVERAVYVSTTAVLEPVRPGAPEGDPAQVMTPPYPTEYQRTKAEAHELATSAQDAGEPLVIACPAYVYGPGDTGPSGQYMMDLLRHRMPGLSTRPTWFSFVHVDDVVAGLVAAGERGAAGATYVLSGEHADVNRFMAMIVKEAGTWGPPLRFPPFVVKLTGTALDAVSRATGVRLPISRELADLAATGARYTHPWSLAGADLGYAPRGLAGGLPETVAEVRRRLER
ncbi:MAG TPA: NAD-dependent epimerase/dehydratase family protein [Longimicrobiales bacterium]|nr:NAD-dependent epimerase/dehydratase family protein [Longimicrobiales bacterium]